MSFKHLLNSISKQMFGPSSVLPEETQAEFKGIAESIKNFDIGKIEGDRVDTHTHAADAIRYAIPKIDPETVVVMGDPVDLTSVSSFKREYLAPIEEPIPTGIDLTPNPGYKKRPKGKTYKYVDPQNDPTFIENLWKA